MLTSEVEQEMIESVIDWENEHKQSTSPQSAIAYSVSLDKRKPKRNNEFEMTLDSAADTHILSMEAACLLFESKSSQLKVIGVSGKRTMADVEGHLVVTVISNKQCTQCTM